MESDTWGTTANAWMSSNISGFTTEPSLVLDSANYIPKLKGSSYKKLFVYGVVLKEDPFFAKITGPFVVGINGLNSVYQFKFEEGQLAALMEEYYFFKEEECTS